MPSYGTLEARFSGTRRSAAAVGREVSSEHFSHRKASSGKLWVTVAALCCLAVGFVLVSTGSVSSITGDLTGPLAASSDPAVLGVKTDSLRKAAAAGKLPNFTPAEDDDEDSLSFVLTNFYHERDGKPAQDYPWLQDVKLAEPYRNTTALVENPRDGYEYYWVVTSSDKGVLARATGADTTVVFTDLDENWVVLEEVRTVDGVTCRRLEEVVMVKYVRREIRTLTDDEREELLDAVSAIR